MINKDILRTLVTNGWTIKNRKSLQKAVVPDVLNEFREIIKGFNNNKLSINIDEFHLSNQNGILSLNVSTKLDKENNNPLNCLIINQTFNFQILKNNILQGATNSLHSRNNDKINLKKSIESQTLKKLYSPEFKISCENTEDNEYITTIIDRKTGEPVEAFFKCVERKEKKDIKGFMENWKIYVKDEYGEPNVIGQRSFEINKVNNTIMPGWMDSLRGNKKFAGIGLRCHQIAIERMIQEGCNSVQISASPFSYMFHYKNGFRNMKEFILKEELDDALLKFKNNSGINENEIQKAIILKEIKGNMYYDSKTIENLNKLSYLNNKNMCVNKFTPMELKGKQLEEWIGKIKEYPILIDK